MKKIFQIFSVFILCLIFVLCSSCQNKVQNGVVFTSEKPKKLENLTISNIFQKNQKIFFIIYSYPEFESDFIRVQILSLNDKVPSLGFSKVWAKDYIIDINKPVFIDYITLNSGNYIMQVFYHKNLEYSFAKGSFKVK